MIEKRLLACSAISVGILGVSLPTHAAVLEDSNLKLDIRNFYLDRDFRKNDAPVSRVGNWSQGFDLQFISGYTDTPVAFGLDVDAQYAIRLDSTGNDGSLPYNKLEDKTADDYGRAGATLKMKYSKTLLQIGDLRPELPVAWHDPSRQLDTIYQGAMIESQEIDDLTLTAGRVWSVVTRESANHEKFYKYGSTDDLDSDALDFAGLNWSLTQNLQASYFYGVMHDIYQQHYIGFAHTADLGGGYKLRSDLRYFDNQEDGNALNGEIDNRAISTGAALIKGPHKVSLAYQKMIGESMFPTPNGYIPQFYLLNWANQPFIRPQERSWGVGYAFDFASVGVPGLSFVSRYIKGTHINRGANLADDTENERDLALKYVVQSGQLRGLGVEWKNYMVKQRFGNDFDENRLITTYTWNIW